MFCGKEIRKKRLFSIKNSAALIVPMDHGITNGPIDGITNISRTIGKVKPTVTGVILHKGEYLHIYRDLYPIPFIMHLSASTINSPTPDRKVLISTVKEAVQLGATAVSIHVNIGNDFETDMLKDFGMVVREANDYGMPVLAMVYPRGSNIKNEFDAEKIAHCVRIAEEVGADIVKTNYTGDLKSFSDIVKETSIPILIAGGKKMDSPEKVYAMVRDAMKAGAAGISIGRNIFQSDDPKKMLSKIYELIWDAIEENDE